MSGRSVEGELEPVALGLRRRERPALSLRILK